ncbi:MAG TPA: peptide deformylase [Patescibacteria group bacterium]|nr:peptide deformylase [Patescibacteria group bacterium]
MLLKIITTPHTILTVHAKPVKKFDNKLMRLVEDMQETLEAQHDPPGVGLAAPQIDIPLQLFITKSSKKAPVRIYCNPKVLQTVNESAQVNSNEQDTRTKLEGCLSIPRIWGEVKRDEKILLHYQTIDAKVREEWISGFEAIIVQHEIDHLQGVLFTHRVMEQKGEIFEEKDGSLVKTQL